MYGEMGHQGVKPSRVPEARGVRHTNMAGSRNPRMFGTKHWAPEAGKGGAKIKMDHLSATEHEQFHYSCRVDWSGLHGTFSLLDARILWSHKGPTVVSHGGGWPLAGIGPASGAARNLLSGGVSCCQSHLPSFPAVEGRADVSCAEYCAEMKQAACTFHGPCMEPPVLPACHSLIATEIGSSPLVRPRLHVQSTKSTRVSH